MVEKEIINKKLKNLHKRLIKVENFCTKLIQEREQKKQNEIDGAEFERQLDEDFAFTENF